MLEERVRASDLVARIGGDEFAVLMSVEEQAHPWQMAERMRLDVADVVCPAGEVPLPVAISGGIALFVPGDDEVSIVRRADEALRRAKKAGGDGVDDGNIDLRHAVAAADSAASVASTIAVN